MLNVPSWLALGDLPNSKSNGQAAGTRFSSTICIDLHGLTLYKGHNTDGFDCSSNNVIIQNRFVFTEE